MRRFMLIFFALLLLTLPAAAKRAKDAEEPKPDDKMTADTFAGLAFRSVGPAFTSGRVSDLAVHPLDRRVWYVTAASGGVWKTTNAGTTWEPIFDDQGSYSIGCVTLDPHNPNVVWIGTGENNSQRSVGYGDGVYKSLDGGKSWTHKGLEHSEHIGKIVVDPRDSDVVWVAAQGPLWSAGGDRGLYKTTDGGETWTQSALETSEHTGVSDLVLDPRDADVMYASTYQRRRRVWTIINGGPESAIYKSTDGGESWRRLESGLPKVDLGRIGLAISPADPEILYAIVEAGRDDSGENAGGFYRSTDRGESWQRRSDYVSGSGQYYQEIFADPKDPDRVYSMDVFMQVTEDGGRTFGRVGETSKHVDNHALWIDPENTDHLIAGCDGGVYETFDRGATWRFFGNLPITQFYKVTVDEDEPFYNIYGGTQDNFSLGGPSRTTSGHGIVNSDWYVTLGGDGFETQVDPENPDIVYSQLQYGVLVRFDRKNGEVIDIQPQPLAGEEALRWNWDSPLVLSPHSNTRLYFAAQRVFRSDDRGDSWRAISSDLSRQIDRDQLEVMGRIWPVDAVNRHRSTSPYGNVVALSESPLVEDLIYAGTDDGLVHVTENGGESWRKIEGLPGVPKLIYVNTVTASRHDAGTAYVGYNNHKSGDFKPYLFKSVDRGATWTSIAGDLPERGSVYALVEDPEKPELLFVGTEFGVFFTVDGGGRWVQLKGGLPIVAMRDLAIQEREGDLVLGTFGRGFYVLDDYTPLRAVSAETLAGEAALFPPRKAWAYVPSQLLGFPGKSFQGDDYYAAANPPFGAVFTYYLRDTARTLRQQRFEAEKEAIEAGEPPAIPSWEELTSEAREDEPAMVLTVEDDAGNVVRRLEGPASSGFHRVAWDLRYPPPEPARVEPFSPRAPWDEPPLGAMVVPGTFSVSMAKRVSGELIALGEPQTVEVEPLGIATLPAADRAALTAFQRQTARLQRAVLGAMEVVAETGERLELIRSAIHEAPAADPELLVTARQLQERLRDLEVALDGDPVKSRYAEPQPPAITDRLSDIITGHWRATSAPTATHRKSYEIAAEAFAPLLAKLRQLVEMDLRQLEDALDEVDAPWTPGRLPHWQPE